MKIAIDIDDTLLENSPAFEIHLAQPNPKVVSFITEVLAEGHEVVLYTARPWNQYSMILAALQKHQIPFNMLVCGKFPYDIMLCDRTVNNLTALRERVIHHEKKKAGRRDSVQR